MRAGGRRRSAPPSGPPEAAWSTALSEDPIVSTFPEDENYDDREGAITQGYKAWRKDHEKEEEESSIPPGQEDPKDEDTSSEPGRPAAPQKRPAAAHKRPAAAHKRPASYRAAALKRPAAAAEPQEQVEVESYHSEWTESDSDSLYCDDFNEAEESETEVIQQALSCADLQDQDT